MPDAPTRLLREVRLLRTYVLASTTAVLAIAVTGFRLSPAPTRFDQIDVQRINIREPDGKLRMVLSNRARSPGGIAHGKQVGGQGQRPGVIFYNDEETENGGLVFEGRADSAGQHAAAQLSFDQYDQDQVLTLVYDDEAGHRTTGMNVFDRPDVPMIPWFAAKDSVDRLPDGPVRSARASVFMRSSAADP